MDKNTNEVINENCFPLSNFYVAAFLISKGFQLVNIARFDSNRSQFIFQDRPERRDLVQLFNFSAENTPEVMVDPRRFVTAIKTLKDRLYQEKELL